MAHKYFADQFDDEEVLFVFRKHPVVMRRGLILAMVMLLLGSVPALFVPSYKVYFIGMACGLLAGALVMLPSWISWYFSVFIVTNERLIQISQKGLFNRSVIDMRLNQIQMVNYQVAGLQQTMLGFGTIMMQTYVGDLIIHDIHHPAAIQKKLLEVLKQQGVHVSGAPMAQKDRQQQPELEEDDEEEN